MMVVMMMMPVKIIRLLSFIILTFPAINFISGEINNFAAAAVNNELGGRTGYTALAFDGGGARAISHIGALKALKTMSTYYVNGRMVFERLDGTSTGCLFAYMTALNIDPNDMESLAYKHHLIDDLLPIDVHSFDDIKIPDPSAWYANLWDVYRLINKVIVLIESWSDDRTPGLMGNMQLVRFVNERLLPLSPLKTVVNVNTTFAELHAASSYKLSCTGTKLTTGNAYIMGYDTTPNMRVVDGLYASMAMPGLFKIYEHDNQFILDGSLSNYCLNELMPKRSTLHLSLVGGGGGGGREHNARDQQDATATVATEITIASKQMSGVQYFSLLHDMLTKCNCALRHTVFLNSPLQLLDTNIDGQNIAMAINRAYLNMLTFRPSELSLPPPQQPQQIEAQSEWSWDDQHSDDDDQEDSSYYSHPI